MPAPFCPLSFVLDSILTFLGVDWSANLMITDEGLFVQVLGYFKKAVEHAHLKVASLQEEGYDCYSRE